MREQTPTIEQLRDRVITQAFVAGQMDAQYTAAVLRHEVESPLKMLKAKAYALANSTMDELVDALSARCTALEQERGEFRQALVLALAMGDGVTQDEQIIAAVQEPT